jgi:hypothetical protein
LETEARRRLRRRGGTGGEREGDSVDWVGLVRGDIFRVLFENGNVGENVCVSGDENEERRFYCGLCFAAYS